MEIKKPSECVDFKAEFAAKRRKAEKAEFTYAVEKCVCLVARAFVGDPISVPMKTIFWGREHSDSVYKYERNRQVLSEAVVALEDKFSNAGWGDTFQVTYTAWCWPFPSKIVVKRRKR